ncbi:MULTISPECIES: hypothetical protein [Lichenihabitans]|uniref:hypothetical protein n=1 Tax=Lichenihabitans TaxID=2723776 RepID=UPI001036D6A8|nr:MULTISPECIES: hypothetical protein [Lichenihabitans]UDL94834.1 hypothetical protein LGH83_00685 [Lichenihabitans sp. PAMC28606]
MNESQQNPAQGPKGEDARDLQTRLYREIGISAVAAALRFTTQTEPGQHRSTQRPRASILREDHRAA